MVKLYSKSTMSSLKLFQDKSIRSVWDEQEEQWYFSVIDVVAVLTDSVNPRDYWFKIKKREKLAGVELSPICRQLKLDRTQWVRGLKPLELFINTSKIQFESKSQPAS